MTNVTCISECRGKGLRCVKPVNCPVEHQPLSIAYARGGQRALRAAMRSSGAGLGKRGVNAGLVLADEQLKKKTNNQKNGKEKQSTSAYKGKLLLQ
jgi:hypothetical protein